MFAFHRAKTRAVGRSSHLFVLCFAAIAGACSSSKQPAGPQVFAWLQPQPQSVTAHAAAAVEIEDDGLPAQSPPMAGIRTLPDDPSQPWSPKYGRSAAGAASVAVPASGIAADDAWRPVTRAADGSIAGTDDAGLPVPKSPEEAGVMTQSKPKAGAYLRLPIGACSGWKCGQ